MVMEKKNQYYKIQASETSWVLQKKEKSKALLLYQDSSHFLKSLFCDGQVDFEMSNYQHVYCERNASKLMFGSEGNLSTEKF